MRPRRECGKCKFIEADGITGNTHPLLGRRGSLSVPSSGLQLTLPVPMSGTWAKPNRLRDGRFRQTAPRPQPLEKQSKPVALSSSERPFPDRLRILQGVVRRSGSIPRLFSESLGRRTDSSRVAQTRFASMDLPEGVPLDPPRAILCMLRGAVRPSILSNVS